MRTYTKKGGEESLITIKCTRQYSLCITSLFKAAKVVFFRRE